MSFANLDGNVLVHNEFCGTAFPQRDKTCSFTEEILSVNRYFQLCNCAVQQNTIIVFNSRILFILCLHISISYHSWIICVLYVALRCLREIERMTIQSVAIDDDK